MTPAAAGGPSIGPQLVARYPARTPIKDKDWPTIMQRAIKTVQENKQLQGYDVVPSTLTEQYKLMGWLQVLASCTACALYTCYTPPSHSA